MALLSRKILLQPSCLQTKDLDDSDFAESAGRPVFATHILTKNSPSSVFILTGLKFQRREAVGAAGEEIVELAVVGVDGVAAGLVE